MTQARSPLPSLSPPASMGSREPSNQPAQLTPGVVTQEMLATFQDLTEVLRERQSLRSRIVSLLNDGARIEPGPLTASAHVTACSAFSFAKLVDVVGLKEAEQLREEIELTFRQTLVIEEQWIRGQPAAGVPPQPQAAIASASAGPPRPPRVEDYITREPVRSRRNRG